MSEARVSQGVEDTTQRDPLLHLAGSLDGIEGYITGMEEDGQRQLLNSDVLPVKGNWEALKELGVIPGEPVDGDPLFIHATLPAGWIRQGTSHAMGSYLVDERGVQRVEIFYKAAFYDRKAHVYPINVGDHLATQAIYGDEPVGRPEKWDVLTTAERSDYRLSLDAYLASALKYPEVYGDGAPRVQALVEAVSA
jgi:hypothetical protein